MRDVRRHFPHQSETLEGIARGAQVPRVWLVRELLAHASRGGGAAIAVSGEVTPRGVLMVRSLAESAVVRRSRPEGGFVSLEMTLPWMSSALAGINEAGLAVVALGSTFEGGASSAPAVLMTQDCLRRLDSVDAALEWCRGRPAAGRATLLLGDASGEIAAVEIAGGTRRVLRPADSGVMAPGVKDAGLAKRVTDGEPVSLARLADVTSGAASAGSPRLGLDPAARRIGVFGTGMPSGPTAAAEHGAAVHWLSL